MRILYMIGLWAALANAQSSTHVFSFSHTVGVQGWQSIANAVRTVGVIENVSLNADAKTLSVTGTPDQIALADFVFHDFDVDSQGPRPATQEYVIPQASDDLVRVFYFNGLAPQQLQEIVNMMRTITDLRLIYQNQQANAIAARGTSAQVAASTWLAGMVAQPPTPGKHEYILPASADYMGRAGTVVRMFFLKHNQNQQELQEIVNALRTVTDASKIYQYLTWRAIAIRGQVDKVAMAEWLVDKLDRPPATAASAEAFVASDVFPRDTTAVRVFYVPSAPTPQAIMEKVVGVRATTRIMKIYPCFAARAIALRGTDSQAAEAEALFR